GHREPLRQRRVGARPDPAGEHPPTADSRDRRAGSRSASPLRVGRRDQQRCAASLRGDGARPRLGSGRQRAVATAAKRTVAPPEAESVQPAPMLPTIGPPIAVPSGVATISAALRAASTLGRLAVVVIDWKSAYVSGTKGP